MPFQRDKDGAPISGPGLYHALWDTQQGILADDCSTAGAEDGGTNTPPQKGSGGGSGGGSADTADTAASSAASNAAIIASLREGMLEQERRIAELEYELESHHFRAFAASAAVVTGGGGVMAPVASLCGKAGKQGKAGGGAAGGAAGGGWNIAFPPPPKLQVKPHERFRGKREKNQPEINLRRSPRIASSRSMVASPALTRAVTVE